MCREGLYANGTVLFTEIWYILSSSNYSKKSFCTTFDAKRLTKEKKAKERSIDRPIGLQVVKYECNDFDPLNRWLNKETKRDESIFYNSVTLKFRYNYFSIKMRSHIAVHMHIIRELRKKYRAIDFYDVDRLFVIDLYFSLILYELKILR